MMDQNNRAARMAFFLLKQVNKAIRDFDMIADGDRIAVAVSGGKDSLSLLRLLQARMKSVRERYQLVAVYVRGDARGPGTPRHLPLEDWLGQAGVEVVIEDMVLPPGEPLPLSCHRCTWNRRRTLFEIAHRLGCNKVAFGHHADDLAETALLNLLYHGRLETMAPRATYFNGTFELIRPLAYVEEKDLRRFAQLCQFPPPPPPCPRRDTSRRQQVKEMLRLVERDCRQAKVNLLRAALSRSDPAGCI